MSNNVARLTDELRKRANIYSRLSIYASTCDQSKDIDLPRLMKIIEGVSDSREGINEIMRAMYEVDKFDLMKLTELRNEARKLGIFGYQSMNKGQLLVRIKKAISEKEE